VAYASTQDLVDRFGAEELAARTDRDGGGQIDAAVVARALEDASAEIELYLAARYAVPVDPAPAHLVQICADIARYRLWQPVPPEGIRQAYQDAVRALRDLADGRAVLAGVQPPQDAPAGGSVRVAAPARRLGRDQLEDYVAS
jgi:phage gp36-like protein